jgi:hypothetical protein
MKARICKLLYRSWRRPLGTPRDGYALLLPMPGDMPFFLDIFRCVVGPRQDEHRVEALVLPDRVPPGFRARFERFADLWPGDVRLVPFQPVAQLLANLVRNGHANHWLQLVHGVEASRATHLILHDADAFIVADEFFDAHYRECVERDLDCLGVGPVWDESYRAVGLDHVSATWEMIFAADWLRRFPPWQHRGHDGLLLGRPHTFDTTLLPQSLTAPGRVGRHEQMDRFIHFNYVICTYRQFQNARGPFEDEYFRILLIRLLIDAFDPGGWPYDTPPLLELARGLTDPSAHVTYRRDGTAGHYDEFRGKLQRLLDSSLLDDRQRQVIVESVVPFDRAFGATMARHSDEDKALR